MSIRYYFKARRLADHAKKLKRICSNKSKPEDVLEAVRTGRKFSLVQKRKEILEFIKLVEQLRPNVIVDIGSSGGGTIRLFSQFADPHARILSIDLDNTPIRQKAFPHLLEEEQQIIVYQGSSYDPETINFLKQWLNGEKIDLLFIDGDHEYDGVKKDFELYSPFVRKGGLIGFHDIVEDYKTRHGVSTPAWVGEVPRYWREIKDKYNETYELIQDPEQDGFGIGVIRW